MSSVGILQVGPNNRDKKIEWTDRQANMKNFFSGKEFIVY